MAVETVLVFLLFPVALTRQSQSEGHDLNQDCRESQASQLPAHEGRRLCLCDVT